MLPRLDLKNAQPKYLNTATLCGLIASLASVMPAHILCSPDDGGVFVAQQAREVQKEVDRLVVQDKDIIALLKIRPSATNSPELKSMKEQMAEIQAQSAQLIKKGNLIEKVTAQPKKGCPSQLFGKHKDSLHNCHGKDDQSPLTHKEPSGILQEGKQSILVFVSFSMPEPSLKKLAQDAEQYNATLVMRGLYEDSFVKTAQKLKELGIGVDINPELFEAHQIKVVPTFVKVKEGKFIKSLKGNVTLEFVDKKFKDQDREAVS